jgi:hypothetical protein
MARIAFTWRCKERRRSGSVRESVQRISVKSMPASEYSACDSRSGPATASILTVYAEFWRD